ncbi:MAG: hypothetical protein ACI361_05195 [Atopobiaceae bacterium]
MGRKDDLKSYAPADIAALGMLTTGPNAKGSDEILSLAIADGTGTILFDEVVRPERRKSWKQAEQRTHISPADVEDKKTLREHAAEIEKILSSAKLIVAYGKDDPAFLGKAGIGLPKAEVLDLGHEFSEAHGAFDPANNGWKMCTLEECTAYFGGKAPEMAAASRAQAVAFAFRELLGDRWYGVPRTKPLRSVDMASGKEFWDYGDEEERICGPDAPAKRPEKAEAEEKDPEESENEREFEEAERAWLTPTPAKFIILAAGGIGFILAGEPEGTLVCAFLAAFLALPYIRKKR